MNSRQALALIIGFVAATTAGMSMAQDYWYDNERQPRYYHEWQEIRQLAIHEARMQREAAWFDDSAYDRALMLEQEYDSPMSLPNLDTGSLFDY